MVGGIEGVKTELQRIAPRIREGHTERVPMGLLFTGPMGAGKTFVAEAFAKESGLTAIKLKNFRSKWVGATEGNLERILQVVQAIGQVLVIIDEGDRAFGSGSDGDGDGGTSSRVIARIKEFMSDTSNRGRILFILMTNRPDKLDMDIKRAGRLDKKIPLLYAQTAEEVEAVVKAQMRRHRLRVRLEFPADRATVSRADRRHVERRLRGDRAAGGGDRGGRRRRRADRQRRARAHGAGDRRLPAVARRQDAGVHGAAGGVRGVKPQDAPQEIRNHERRRAAGAARDSASRVWQPEVTMDFFPEIEISALQAEAIARGLYGIAVVDGVHERELALISDFYHDAVEWGVGHRDGVDRTRGAAGTQGAGATGLRRPRCASCS